jgi:nitroreductase
MLSAVTSGESWFRTYPGNPTQMQFDDVILGRRSIRGYKPDPVPKALIAEIIGLAMRAPSSMNTQPWNFYVISGEPLDRIRAGNTERNVAGIPHSREFRTGQPFAGKHRDRQVGVAKQLFSAMGIERDNKDKRQDWVLRGFRQFDAPVCVIITYDRVLDGSDDTPFDCGAVATALVNAAWSRGLGAVINSQGIMQSPVVRVILCTVTVTAVQRPCRSPTTGGFAPQAAVPDKDAVDHRQV